MKKQLAIRLFGAFAALMLLNGLIRTAFDPSWQFGNDVLTIKMEDFNKDPAQYNTAMIGSSCIFWNLDPVLFDSVQPPEWDIRSFNFGSGGTTPPETYFILENLLSQNPHSLKHIVIELRDDNHFPPHHVNTLRKRYFMSPRWYAFIVRSAIGSPIPIEERKNSIRRYGLALLERFFNIDYFNSIYAPDEETRLKTEERTYNIRNRSVQGFLPVLYNREEEVREAFLRDTTQPGIIAKRVSSLKKDGVVRSVNKNHAEFIRSMISRCNDEGIHLVFFLHPKLDPMYLEGTLGLSYYIPENHLIDLSDPDDYPELYLVENSLNNNHFNIRGTEILSNLAARKFTEIHQGWLRTQAPAR